MLYSFWLLATLVSVSAFNIDQNSSVIYQMPKDGRPSFFGYSVGFKRSHGGKNSSWLVLVGAPRANDSTATSWNEPGVIFSCNITGPCQSLALLKSTKKSESLYNGTFSYSKSFIGVAMDIDQDNFVVCGQGVSYLPNNYREKELKFVGGCLAEHNRTEEWFYPFAFNNSLLQHSMKGPSKTSDYDLRAYGMAGMSVSLMPSNNLLLGAPNYFISTGSIAYAPKFKMNSMTVWNEQKLKMNKLWRAAYYGYSVAAVKVRTDMFFIIGAPRSEKLCGSVVIVKDMEAHHLSTKLQPQDCSRNFGSYFGASLAVNDLNDGSYEVVVGSPMYSDSEILERGAVTYYKLTIKWVKSRSKVTAELQWRKEGARSRSHFGACVAIPGDFDGDGFKDVFVGAPEENEQGAVYIYYGRVRGVDRQRKQVIYATAFTKPISGFGISVSRAQDIDSNGYPDIAVGASKSDAVVVLRARPIVQVDSIINCIANVERNLTTFNLQVCPLCKCNVTHVRCDIDIKINVDTKEKRAFIQDSSTAHWNFSKVSANSSDHCKNFSVDVRPNLDSTDEADWKPLNISVETKLVKSKELNSYVTSVWAKEEVLSGLDVVCDDKSVDKCDTKIEKMIRFKGDCENDTICNVNFASVCEKNIHDALEFGKNHDAHFTMNVTNFGEPSRETNLTVTAEGISAENGLSAPNCKCTSQHHFVQQCICNLGYMAKNAQESVTFSLHVNKWLQAESDTVTLTGQLTTSGQQNNQNGLSCQTNITVKSGATASLITSPSNNLLADRPFLDFTQTFEFWQKGLVLFNNLTVQMPVSICDFPIAQVMVMGAPLSSHSRSRSANESCLWDLRVNSTKRSLRIQCGDNYVNCVNTTAREGLLKIDIKFNASIFNKLVYVDGIDYVSNGTAHASLPFGARAYNRSAMSSISRPVISKVDISIWMLSLIVTSMILAIIVPALVKIGFFRRKTKEKLDALKAQDFILQRFSMYEPTEGLKDSANLTDSRSVSIKTLSCDNGGLDMTI